MRSPNLVFPSICLEAEHIVGFFGGHAVAWAARLPRLVSSGIV
jgi:hypothetical protein